MDNKARRLLGITFATKIFEVCESLFAKEDFMNAKEFKRWVGQLIKDNWISLYQNLTYKDYKAIVDVTICNETYHVGIDFGQQAVHVTLGPGDVYSLYYRTPCEPE